MKYMDYVRNNPEGYWFKRKLYGWGWTPVKWQGWLATAVYLALVVLFASTLDKQASANDVSFTFALPLILLTVAFITLAYKKGQKPKWQWGVEKE
jgi:hypothetical protein